VHFNAPALVAATGALPTHELISVGGNVKLGDFRPYVAYYKSDLDPTVAGRLTQKNRILDLGLEWAGYSQMRFRANYVDDKGTALNGIAGRDGKKRTLVASAEYFLSKRTRSMQRCSTTASATATSSRPTTSRPCLATRTRPRSPATRPASCIPSDGACNSWQMRAPRRPFSMAACPGACHSRACSASLAGSVIVMVE
jgi:hypothetical protein